MAGRGRAPKDASRRINRHPPARGEWIDLPELRESILPDLRDEAWSHHAEATWLAWQQDRSTTQWGDTQIAFAMETLRLIDHLNNRPSATMAAEIRQRMDSLGLTPKGRIDLRWRVSEPAEVVDLPTPQQRERRVRAVDG